jgi:hypothetical protein
MGQSFAQKEYEKIQEFVKAQRLHKGTPGHVTYGECLITEFLRLRASLSGPAGAGEAGRFGDSEGWTAEMLLEEYDGYAAALKEAHQTPARAESLKGQAEALKRQILALMKAGGASQPRGMRAQASHGPKYSNVIIFEHDYGQITSFTCEQAQAEAIAHRINAFEPAALGSETRGPQ